MQEKLNVEASSEQVKPQSQTEQQDYSENQRYSVQQDDEYEEIEDPQQDFNRHYRR